MITLGTAPNQRQTAAGNQLTMVVVHGNEHYGNLVTYMRIKGIVPPFIRTVDRISAFWFYRACRTLQVLVQRDRASRLHVHVELEILEAGHVDLDLVSALLRAAVTGTCRRSHRPAPRSSRRRTLARRAAGSAGECRRCRSRTTCHGEYGAGP